MAVTASGLYVANVIDAFDASQTAFAYLADTCKMSLFTNSITPNFSTDTAYGVSPYNANEVSGTGYTAAGVALGSKTITESPTGTVMFDAADLAWTTATFSSVRAGLVHDTTISNWAIVLVNFGADYSVTAGTFTVQLASGGLFTIDVTP